MEMITKPTYAFFGRRFVAVLLDTMIIIIPCWIASHIIPFLGGFIVAFFYSPIFECSAARATPGKHVMGIQVTDLQGGQITFRASLIRFFVKLGSAVFLFLGHLVALFTDRNQALHDLLAETVVVYGRSGPALADAWIANVKTIFGGNLAGTVSSLSSNPGSDTRKPNVIAELERLQALRERGGLTEGEFQTEKRKLLGN